MNAKVIGIFTLLVALCLYLVFAAPESFLTGNNVENLLRRTALYGVLGIGVAFVIITGGIDLSIGSVVVLCACLLSIFLRVDYVPFDGARVLAVEATERRIVLPGMIEAFKPGDRIRYFGGRRAHNALLTVTKVSQIQHDTGLSTAIEVDAPLSSNDTYGQVAKVYQVASFDPAAPSITIAAAIPRLAPRDQITLVHPQAGLKQLPITDARVQEGRTILMLGNDPGSDFGTDWLVIPIERRQRMPAAVGVAAVLAVGLCLGLLHGLLITRLNLQPFVVTLCGLLFYRGITRWLVNDQVQGFGNEYAGSLTAAAQGELNLAGEGAAGLGIPYPFFILLGVAAVAAVFLNKTIWGRYMLALGRNEEAARYSGIRTGRITILAYVICTGLAALGGMLFALDANSISPSSFGNFFELYAIAAAVLGGCSLRGGEGSIVGVVIGTALMQTLYNLIVLLQISDKLEFAIIGAVILGGVVADELVKRYAASRRAARQAAG